LDHQHVQPSCDRRNMTRALLVTLLGGDVAGGFGEPADAVRCGERWVVGGDSTYKCHLQGGPSTAARRYNRQTSKLKPLVML